MPELGGVKLASNNEEYLLLELLPNVANPFLRRRRSEEVAAAAPKEEPKKEEPKAAMEPITGPTFKAPMGGKIISVDVKPGQTVKKGELLFVYEAMKMENDVMSEMDGVVKRVFIEPGDVVSTDQVLIEFE